MSFKNICFIMFLVAGFIVNAQNQSTDLEYLVNKNYIPTYQESYPEWAKLLYTDRINYYELVDQYEKWENNASERYKILERCYKLWVKAAHAYLDSEGFIRRKEINKAQMNRYYNQKNLVQIENDGQGNWTFLGPKETFFLASNENDPTPDDCSWQTNVYSFAIFNQNEDILYAGTETGFINKSIDGGESWTLVNENYPAFGGVTAVAIHPSNPDIVYYSAGSQMHKTTDGGIQWQPLLPEFGFFSADKILIHPTNPNILLAAGAQGVYRTENAGNNWVRVWSRPTFDIEFAPNNLNQIYCISNVSGNFSVVVSEDGGNQFEMQSSFPSGIAVNNGGLLAISPAAPDELYAILLSNDNTPFLYQGNMNTGTWQRIATGQTTALAMDNGQGFFDLVLEVDPTDANIIFVGTTTLYKSNNGGRSFNAIGGYNGPFPIHPDIQWMELLGNGKAWVATDGGFTYSTDNFTTVTNADAKNNLLIGSDMWGFDQAWNEDLIVGGRYHNGNTAISSDYDRKALRLGGAESPTGWVLNGKEKHVVFDDLGPGIVLPKDAVSPIQARFSYSKHPNMDEFGGRRGNLFAHPNYFEVLYLGAGNGFWRSDDFGESYDLLHDFGNRIRFCDIAHGNPNIMYADIEGQGLHKSEDGGVTWTSKPSLTDGTYASSYWNGKLHFVISPKNADVIYACLQNGTWSADKGKVLRSEDGGDTWVDWSANLDEYTKSLAIQPDSSGNDIVYLYTNSKNGDAAKCFVRKSNQVEWMPFDQGLPLAMNAIFMAPYYKDGKLRVAGNAGVWESPLLEAEFEPQVQAWINSPIIDCSLDTMQLEDHSIINHQNCTWTWTVEPSPAYIESSHMRNPKIVFGDTGYYDITLEIDKNGRKYRKSYEQMVRVNACPSINNCNKPAILPKEDWKLMYVSSEETVFPGLATMAFDDDVSTIWHTRWTSGSDAHPHEIQIDLGDTYAISEVICQARTDSENGRIRNFELYVSEDKDNWGAMDTSGQFANDAAPQTLHFNTPLKGKYLRLVALSEVNGNIWTSLAELSVRACISEEANNILFENLEKIKAYPIPAQDNLNIEIPISEISEVKVYNIQGQLLSTSVISDSPTILNLSLAGFSPGAYFAVIKSKNNQLFRLKFIKQ